MTRFYAWCGSRLPLRVCQWLFDLSPGFRAWWGPTYPPLKRNA